ncbi:MAG: sugar ABC transporter substrate-binding protein [Chloroflexota bacterium]|nr:MAG: sugar ABC transporter substrate-binding protein [Chloroflexota bacterium]
MHLGSSVTRRRLLGGFGGVGALALLAACAAPAPTATPIPAKPAEAPKPAAPAVAPAKPAEAPKPAEAAKPAAPAAAPAAVKPAAGAPAPMRLHVRAGPEEDLWPAIIPQFEQKYNVKFELIQVPHAEHVQKMQTMIAAGELGDVIHNFTGDSSFQLFVASGIAIPLDKYVADEKFELSQYYKFTIDLCKVDGKLGGLPFKGHPSRVGIFHNIDLLKAAGAKIPTNNSTYDDLVEAAKKVHKQTGTDVETYGWSNPGRDIEFYILMSRFGGKGDIFSADGKKSRLNEAEVQWGWTWTHDMFNVHKVGMNPLATNPDPSTAFLNGKLAIFRSNVGTKAAYQKIDKFKWGMTLAPKGPGGQRGSLAQADVVGVTKFSKVPDIGWQFLKAMTSKDAGIILGKQTGNKSATPGGRADVYESPDLVKLPYPEGVQDNTALAMKEAEPFTAPYNFRGPEVQRAIDPLYDSLVLGKSKADKAYYDQLHQAVQDVLDKGRP